MTATGDAVIAAARALMRAGQWDRGDDLLAASGDDPPVLLARAELAVDRDFWLSTSSAGDAVAAAQAVAGTAGPAYAWEVELLATHHAYFSTIIGPDGQVRIGPGRHDAETIAALTARAGRVHETAPSDARGGWAAFWRA